MIDPDKASVAFKAGNPLPHDARVAEWTYWRADIDDVSGTESGTDSAFVPAAGGLKDTTHMAIIDKDGNIFDRTPAAAGSGVRSSWDRRASDEHARRTVLAG